MTGAMMILAAMVVIGAILFITDKPYRKRAQKAAATPEPAAEPAGEECCGMHTVCEKTNLSPVTGDIVYYDDEELDRFAGRDAADYTPEETEEFRDILLTLREEDVAGWSRSIQVRGIALPESVRDELLLIVGELKSRVAAVISH